MEQHGITASRHKINDVSLRCRDGAVARGVAYSCATGSPPPLRTKQVSPPLALPLPNTYAAEAYRAACPLSSPSTHAALLWSVPDAPPPRQRNQPNPSAVRGCATPHTPSPTHRTPSTPPGRSHSARPHSLVYPPTQPTKHPPTPKRHTQEKRKGEEPAASAHRPGRLIRACDCAFLRRSLLHRRAHAHGVPGAQAQGQQIWALRLARSALLITDW